MFNFNQALTEVFDRKAERRISDPSVEREIIHRAKNGDESATLDLVYAYAPALRNAVKWFAKANPGSTQISDVEDVRSRAVMGLIEAIHAFDPEKHERLAAIASGYITDEVSQGASSVTGFTVPPRTLKRFFGILRRAEGNIYEAMGMCRQYDMDPETFLSVLSAVRNVESYNDEGDHDGHDESRWVFEQAEPLWSSDPVRDAEDKILVEAVFACRNDDNDLTERQSQILLHAYGFKNYGEPQSDAAVGEAIGATRPTVQRDHKKALAKAADRLGA